MAGVYQTIRDAIASKQLISANYNGYKREMCPHAIGMKNGREKALFYQFGGQSSSGTIVPGSQANWRCLFLDEISGVVAYPGKWETADNHSRKQTCIDDIDLEVDM